MINYLLHYITTTHLILVYSEIECLIKTEEILTEDNISVIYLTKQHPSVKLSIYLTISLNTAKKYLTQMEEPGIMSSTKIGKEIVYLNIDLYNLLSET